MLTGDIEDAKHAVARRLGSQEFVDRLAAIDAEKSPALETPAPRQIFEGEVLRLSDQGYPVAEVIGVRTLYDDPSQQVKEATHEIEVIWTQVGDDELVVTTQLQRLVRATRDLFWNALLSEIASEPVLVAAEEYSALMPSSVQAFVKGASTRVLVRTIAL